MVVGLNAVLLTTVGISLGIEGALKIGVSLLATQSLIIPAFTAISMLLGLLSPRYVLLGIVYGAIVETGFGQIPTNINVLSLSRHFQGLMGRCSAIGETVPLTSWGIPGSILAVLAIASVAVIVSMLLFTYREFLDTEAPK